MVHRQLLDRWLALPDRVGLESTQQLWDHVAASPGQVPAVGSSTILKGTAGKPTRPGFSRTVHYEISGAGRIDYQFNDRYRTSPEGDEHGVVFILRIDLGSH